ncbi:class I SAM-dependent methyltransferase [Thiovibrio sp. JS02]
MDETGQDIFFNIINRFVGFHSRDAARETKNNTDCEYPFVAMDTRQVFAQLEFVARLLNADPDAPAHTQPRFLDIGCGIGNILLVAEQYGFDVYGIEKDEYPFTVATRLIGEEKVSRDDIWTYQGLEKFEVLYYFRPFSGREQQLRFEKLVEDSMRVGAILIANHKNSDAISQDRRFERLNTSLPIWQKTSAG